VQGAVIGASALLSLRIELPTWAGERLPIRPGAWSGWLDHHGPVVTAFAVVRVLVLAIGTYLAVVVALAVVVRATRWRTPVHLVRAVTLPSARRLVDLALGLSVATAGVPAVAVLVGPPRAVVMEVADDADVETIVVEGSVTTGPEDGAVTVSTGPIGSGSRSATTTPAGRDPGPPPTDTSAPATTRRSRALPTVPASSAPAAPPTSPPTTAAPTTTPTTAPNAAQPTAAPEAATASTTASPTGSTTASTTGRGRSTAPPPSRVPTPPAAAPAPVPIPPPERTLPTPPPLAPAAELPPADAAPAAELWEVRGGEHFWSIAEQVLAASWRRAPTEAEVARYWAALVEHNRDRLAVRDNPDLIYAGQMLELVPVPSGSPR
jgi:hypothetical protein